MHHPKRPCFFRARVESRSLQGGNEELRVSGGRARGLRGMWSRSGDGNDRKRRAAVVADGQLSAVRGSIAGFRGFHSANQSYSGGGCCSQPGPPPLSGSKERATSSRCCSRPTLRSNCSGQRGALLIISCGDEKALSETTTESSASFDSDLGVSTPGFLSSSRRND